MMAFGARKGQADRTKKVTVAAPIGGDDTVSPGGQIPPERSILSFNLMGCEYGLRSRLGWREWVTGLDGPTRSGLPFFGSTAANNRLFVTTQTGIWDCSSSTASPSQVVTFGTQGSESGFGVSAAFTDLNGDHWLLYTDESNGYFTYKESTSTWAQITAGSGPNQMQEKQSSGLPALDPTKLAFVFPWKNRLWFIEKDTQRGWYLPLNQITGAGADGAQQFYFGSRFIAGGDLRCLASWTFDGGSGIDDRLVAISGGGDVVIYQGTDPSSASTFALVGVWQIGSVPVGRRLTTTNGGDLLIMSSIGILPVSSLSIGSNVLDRSQYSTYQIANLFNQLQAATSNLRGWMMRIHPQDAALIVLVPVGVGQPSQQLAMSLTTKGWHRYRDLPMGQWAESWDGLMYFGTEDGRVCVNDGYLDSITLDDPNAFTPIDWSLVTAYSNLGSPLQKRMQGIRVKIMSQGGVVPVNAEGRFDFDISEAAIPQATTVVPGSSTWDTGLWDSAVWSGDYVIQTQSFGAFGMGADMALAVRGKASSRMTLVEMDVVFDVGGFGGFT